MARTTLAACLFLCACGTGSVYPFYTAREPYADSTLLGEWRDSAGTEGAVFRREAGGYTIVYTDKGKSAAFVGRLFRLGGRRALDVTPGDLPDSLSGKVAEVYWGLMMPGHALFWLDWNEHRLAFAGIDPDSLKAYVRAHPLAVRHIWSKPDSMLWLDAPTAELQRFVVAFARRPHALADSTVWVRMP